tara:strand:- start:665 stop:1675 length:1011 start_codon:yes stop_codon:yes gene_type:complete
MKYFIFTDSEFKKGFFFHNSERTITQLDQIDEDKPICFVIPNETLKHTYHESFIKNKQNLHAAIKNSENKNSLKHSFDEEVLETNLKNHFYLIKTSALNNLKAKLSHINDSAMITSDACFYANNLKEAVEIDDFVYLKEGEKCIKLNLKAANLANINYKKINLKKLNISNLFASVELNLLTINQLFNLKKIKSYALALISLILIINIFGAANLVNNNLKIMNINNNKKELFLTLFPDKDPSNIELEINNKLIEVNSKNSNFSQLLNLVFTNIGDINSINFIEYAFDNTQLKINCTFSDDIEQSVFIRNMKINGVELETSNQVRNGNTISTEFKYDI